MNKNKSISNTLATFTLSSCCLAIMLTTNSYAALSGSITISCPQTAVVPGSSIDCSINGSTNEPINAVSAQISMGSGLTLSSSVKSIEWDGSVSGSSIDVYSTNKTGSFSIATITVKAESTMPNSTTISVNSIQFSDASFKLVPGTSSPITITKADPPVIVPSTPEPVAAPSTPASSSSAAKSTTKASTATKSDNNFLSKLIPSFGLLVFDKNTTEYSIEVPYDTTELGVEVQAENDKATIAIEGGKDLQVGDNTMTIKVTAENKAERVYTIRITKLEKNRLIFGNNYLKTLAVKGHKIKFTKTTYSYKVYGVTEKSLTITATPDDTKAKVAISGNDKLKNGSEITITVTAQNGSTRQYKIKTVSLWSMVIVGIIIVATLAVIGVATFISIKIAKKLREKRSQMPETVIDAPTPSDLPPTEDMNIIAEQPTEVETTLPVDEPTTAPLEPEITAPEQPDQGYDFFNKNQLDTTINPVPEAPTLPSADQTENPEDNSV